MKTKYMKLATIIAGATILSGCSAILPSSVDIEADDGSTIQLTYQQPRDEQQCTEIKTVSFNPEYSIYLGLFHSGPSLVNSVELSDDYFIKQAKESGANYINRNAVSETGFLGLYSSSNDIDALLFQCDALTAKL